MVLRLPTNGSAVVVYGSSLVAGSSALAKVGTTVLKRNKNHFKTIQLQAPKRVSGRKGKMFSCEKLGIS